MSGKRRERWDLGDGAYMDISIEPGASPETIAALRELGTAAVQRMRDDPGFISQPTKHIMGVDAPDLGEPLGASLTYDEAEIPERGTPFRLASRPAGCLPVTQEEGK